MPGDLPPKMKARIALSAARAMNRESPIDARVSPRQLAEACGFDQRTAQRRMKALAEEHPEVVDKSTTGRLTSTVLKLLPFFPELRIVMPVDRKVAALTRRVEDLESRLDVAIKKGTDLEERLVMSTRVRDLLMKETIA